jgi:predicted nucleic acid-binding protein
MPERESCFIDTNIWLYAFTDDDTTKKDISQAIIKSSQPVISGQVVNEVCVNLLKRANLPEAQISELVETFYQKYDVIEPAKVCYSLPRNFVRNMLYPTGTA